MLCVVDGDLCFLHVSSDGYGYVVPHVQHQGLGWLRRGLLTRQPAHETGLRAADVDGGDDVWHAGMGSPDDGKLFSVAKKEQKQQN